MMSESTVRRFVATVVFESDGTEGDFAGHPTGSYVYAIDFNRGGYYQEILESSCFEIAPWTDGSEDA